MEFLRRTSSSLVRLLEAVGAGFLVCSALLCASLLPMLSRGPLGYGQATPSLFAQILLHLAPLTWFCYAAGAVTFYEVFNRRLALPTNSIRPIGLIVSYFIGAGFWVLSDLLTLHASYPVEQSAPTTATVAINLALLALLITLTAKRALQKEPHAKQVTQ